MASTSLLAFLAFLLRAFLNTGFLHFAAAITRISPGILNVFLFLVAVVALISATASCKDSKLPFLSAVHPGSKPLEK